MGRMKYFKDCDVVVTEKEGLETKPLPYPSRTGEKLSPEEIEELVEKYIQDQDVIADFVVETDVYEKKEMEEHQKVNAIALWMSGKFQKAGYNKSVALSLGQRVTRRLYDMQQYSGELPEEERQIPTVMVPPEDTDKPEPKAEMLPVQGSDKLFSKKILDLSGDAYKIYACMVAKESEQKEFCFPCAEYEHLGLGSSYTFKRAMRELSNSGLVLKDRGGVPTDETKFTLAEIKGTPQLRIEPEKPVLSGKIKVENVLIEADRIMNLIEMMDTHYADHVSKVADKRTEEFYSVFAIMKKRYEDFEKKFRQIVYG